MGFDSAINFIAETGVDMSAFTDTNHFVSYLGLSPINNESADKKKSVRISNVGTHIKPLLIQYALAAIKSKKCLCFKINYDKIKKCRRNKRTIVAIARMMTVCLYHMFNDGKNFHLSDKKEA